MKLPYSLTPTIMHKDGLWVYECSEFNIVSYDRSQLEAFKGFIDSLSAFLEVIVSAEDEELTTCAREMKRKFLSYLTVVGSE